MTPYHEGSRGRAWGGRGKGKSDGDIERVVRVQCPMRKPGELETRGSCRVGGAAGQTRGVEGCGGRYRLTGQSQVPEARPRQIQIQPDVD